METLNLSHWNQDFIQTLSSDRLHQLTRRAISTTVAFRVLLGRFLLEVRRRKLYREFGCSSTQHYAVRHGLKHRDATEFLRVATRLEELPLLQQAAEEGTIHWKALTEVVRVAIAETEQTWLSLARNHPFSVVQKLVRKTSFGADPLVHHEAQRAELTRLILELTPELRVLLEQVSRDFSEEEGRPLSPIEVLERLLAENRAAAKPTQDPIEEAQKDLAAEEEALERAVEPTWVDGWIGVAAEQEPYSEELSILVREHWSNSRLRFNKDSRHLTPAQRQEIQRRDCYTCSTPGCGRHLWLQVHHIVFYCKGGETLPYNCLCLCSRCHKHLHDGHLQVEGKAPDQLVWTDGRGERLDRFGGYLYPAATGGFSLLQDGGGEEWGVKSESVPADDEASPV